MREINVGMIGSGLVGRAHCFAYKVIPLCFQPPPAVPRLKVVADVTEELAKTAAEGFGFEEWVVPWNKLVKRDDVELVDVVTPNNVHKEMSIAAVEEGKNVLCEKPLALNAWEAREMYEAAEKAGVKHYVDFNYRRTPAVMLAKQLIEEGRLGKIYHFRALYLQDWPINPNYPLSWRFRKEIAGSGALGDLGSHIIDLARFLVGEFKEVAALTETFVKERPIPATSIEPFYKRIEVAERKGKVDVDDAVAVLAKLGNGVLGVLEASRFSYGRKNFQTFEISGEKGSIYFDYQRMNELKFYSAEDPKHIQGFKTIYTGPEHPYGRAWWPLASLSAGWSVSFANTIHDFMEGIVEDKEVQPTFYDGWKCNEICDAIMESVENGKWVSLPS